MIVKNEEKFLARCLDTIADLMDEIIIVDTGSSDSTKLIASKYTDKIYDFEWIDDFSAARNFAFSKASCDYIYSADADEVLDEENRKRFLILKKTLLPEIDIVQMKYKNQLKFKTVYNFDEEYRPKLFKRLRTFVWEEAVHEAVRLEPLIYDSDVVILHLPEENHAGRDLENFRKQTAKGVKLSKRLHGMYARELMMAGCTDDFIAATGFFEDSAKDETRSPEEIKEACTVLTRCARLCNNVELLLKYSSKVIASDGCSETCLDLALFYESRNDPEEALVWFYNAAYETAPILVETSGTVEPLEGLVRCCGALGMTDALERYKEALNALPKNQESGQ